jgi:hypothetical protein
LEQLDTEIVKRPPTSVSDASRFIRLELAITDADSIAELLLHGEGVERNDYAVGALRIGLISLRHARGQIDADAVKREGDRLLSELKQSLEGYRGQLNENLSNCLREYFDPSGGKFQERVERLIRKDGDLEQVLRRQIGQDDSELAKTLTAHIGGNSPLMKLLDPQEANGVVQKLRDSVDESLQAEREQILQQFSLDDKQSALSRLVVELGSNNGNLQQALSEKVDEVVAEFSLDNEDSALSRLVRKVETAQQTISKEFSLDNEQSALSRMSAVIGKATAAIDDNLTLDNEESALFRLKRELLEVLDRHEGQANSFQAEVKASLAEIRGKREEAARSTAHGKGFEGAVWEFVSREAQRSGDIPSNTGATTGAIKNCKIGDSTITLGQDTFARGEKIVLEAKEEAKFDLSKAQSEIEIGRKNRDAAVGVFVFSSKTAPEGQEVLLRQGSDVFVVWDADDLSSDVNLKAAVMLARALCMRQVKAQTENAAGFKHLDAAILELEREAKRLAEIKTWTETIKNNGAKVLGQVTLMTEGLETQIGVLRETTLALKKSAGKGAQM